MAGPQRRAPSVLTFYLYWCPEKNTLDGPSSEAYQSQALSFPHNFQSLSQFYTTDSQGSPNIGETFQHERRTKWTKRLSSLRGNRKCRKCQFKIICRTLRVAPEDSISTKIEDTVHRNKDPNKAFRNLKNMVCKNKNLIAVLEAKSRKSPERNKKKV